jgi:hypothetical protein
MTERPEEMQRFVPQMPVSFRKMVYVELAATSAARLAGEAIVAQGFQSLAPPVFGFVIAVGDGSVHAQP